MSPRVLFAARESAPGVAAPFVEEQAASLRDLGAEVEVYRVRRGGAAGYVEAAREMRRRVRPRGRIDIVHGHGPAAICATAIQGIPLVATFHGSDVVRKKTRPFAAWIALRAAWSIFVSSQLRETAWLQGRRHSVIPCGVDTDRFTPVDREEARRRLGWDSKETLILFSSSFSRALKNAPLAQAGVEAWGRGRLVELRGYSREDVSNAINAADALVLTSFWEGSPQVVKEAMACNTPVVSVDIGDTAERLGPVDNSIVVDRTPEAIAEGLEAVAGTRSNGREHVMPFSLPATAERILEVYEQVLAER